MKATAIILTSLALSGCECGPDMNPIGAGLSVIGLGVVIAALICVLFGGHSR